MKNIKVHVPPIVLYLMVLSFYGFMMMILNLNELEQKITEEEKSVFRRFARKSAHNVTSLKKSLIEEVQHIKSVEDFFNRLSIKETHCQKVVDIGGLSCQRRRDGNKPFCFDEDVFIPHYNCNVYSFGIGEDMTFDYEMAKYGCDVFMFDPTIPISFVKQNLQKNDKLHFYHLGLAKEKMNKTFNWDTGTENVKVHGHFDTYDNVRKEIGHLNLPVHYLKMDIEGWEWTVLMDIIKNNQFPDVKQFSIEIHAQAILRMSDEQAVKYLQSLWEIVTAIKHLGYLRSDYQETVVEATMYKSKYSQLEISTCGEIFYLKRG